MSQTPPRSRGFTLIELLVVLAILGIASFAVMTFTTDRQAGAVKAMAQEVIGSLREAELLAKSSGRNVYFRSSGAGRSFALEYGVFPLDVAGNEDRGQPFEVRGTFRPMPAHAAYARIDIGDADYGTVNPAADILGEAINGVRFVAAGSQPLTPADPTAADAVCFQPTGAVNRACHVVVVGLRADAPSQTSAMVVISFTPEAGLRAFTVGSGEQEAWRRF